MQLKSILCPIDFSDFSATAYPYALSVAEHYDATVFAMHVVELWKYPFADYGAHEADYAKLALALNQSGEVRLREFVEKHSHAARHPRLVFNVGNTSDSILSFAETQNIDLIIMGSHGRRGFDRLVLGSTADRVMRRASCPVLVMAKQSQASAVTGPNERQVHRLSRVLHCTDFSKNSEKALAYAISAAAEYNAELLLLHVVEHAPSGTKMSDLLASCQRDLDKLIPAQEHKAVKVTASVKVGKPYQQIVEYAEQAQVDLITMAARGADAFDRAVFGSTTYRVIQLGPCPVLSIHT